MRSLEQAASIGRAKMRRKVALHQVWLLGRAAERVTCVFERMYDCLEAALTAMADAFNEGRRSVR